VSDDRPAITVAPVFIVAAFFGSTSWEARVAGQPSPVGMGNSAAMAIADLHLRVPFSRNLRVEVRTDPFLEGK